MSGFRIAGWGHALPEGRVTNAELATRLDTDDKWIRERTGIVERRVGGTTVELATAACEAALRRRTGTAAQVDQLILATSTPDRLIPGSASTVAGRLGLRCGTTDMNAACAGFVHALAAAQGYLHLGAGAVLVVGADALSPWTDPDNRGTAILFADGAGALVLEAGGGGSLLGWHAASDPAAESVLYCDHGGLIQMEGQAVFKLAVRAAVDSVETTLDRAELKAGDLDLLVAHQANQRITDAIARRLGMEPARVVSTLSYTGNSSAATVPTALSIAADDGRLREGAHAMLVGFGAGMTWASVVLRWATT